MKPIKFSHNNHDFRARVSFNHEFDEYQVLWTVDGEHREEWTYFTDDRADAVLTMNSECRRIKNDITTNY